LLLGVLLAVLTCAAFGSAFRAGFVWDDDQHIVSNANLRDGEGLWRIWFDPGSSPQYYPLAHSSWWMEYHLWGLDPRGYHAVNVALQVINVLLLWRLLARLGAPGAWFGALLFGIHPLQVETVAWLMERKNLLSCSFYLLSFLALLPLLERRAGEKDSELAGRGKVEARYGLGLALFLCALLSKSVAATLPAAFLLVAWWKNPALLRRWRLWARMLPFFAAGIISGLYTAYLERAHVGAAGAEFQFSPMDRVYIAGRALWAYLDKLVWPHPLMLFYPRWDLPAGVWQMLFPVAFAALLAGLWLGRGRIGRGPLTAMLFFAGTLFPALGFINIFPMRYSFVADHFQYMACIGPLALIAGGMAWLASHRPAARPWMMGLGAAIVVVLIPVSNSRGAVYRDASTLYADLVGKNPGLWAGHALLGQEELNRGEYARAVVEFERAVQLAPVAGAGQGAGRARADSQEGLANALLGAGNPERARVLLEELVRQDQALPAGSRERGGRAALYNDLANVMVVLKRPSEAAGYYREAIARDPGFAEAHYNLGDLLAAGGQSVDAAREYLTALELRPEWPEAALKAGAALADSGRLPEALRYFERAAALRPGWASAERAVASARAALGR
jgi:tetratricopeptide (TPR) repeat protein